MSIKLFRSENFDDDDIQSIITLNVCLQFHLSTKILILFTQSTNQSRKNGTEQCAQNMHHCERKYLSGHEKRAPVELKDLLNLGVKKMV